MYVVETLIALSKKDDADANLSDFARGDDL